VRTRARVLLLVAALLPGCPAVASAQAQVVHAEMSYRAPGTGPAPNFSPKGTQVALSEIASGTTLPAGAARPAKTGTIKVGPNERSWVGILVSADPEHPRDLCRLFLDRNRNGDFADDGPPLTAVPSVREKTGDSWSSFSRIELMVPYLDGTVEPYMVSVWIVRQGDAVPEVARYSVSSWRAGTVEVDGVRAVVAAMDGNNDAVFDANDMWSVMEASAPDSARQVLTLTEARSTDRLMFVKAGDRELVLEFRGFSPDGRAMSFAVVKRPVTKTQDRAGDDTLSAERARPRAAVPFSWETRFDSAAGKARNAGRFLIVDFWTSWCGPCRMMDEWIWTDADVTAALRASYVGVKLDGDLEKQLVSRFRITGYPTFIVLDAAGKEVRRFAGYMSSRQVLDWLAAAGR
jgi:thiol-disulfide isomerase/thioredoxin